MIYRFLLAVSTILVIGAAGYYLAWYRYTDHLEGMESGRKTYAASDTWDLPAEPERPKPIGISTILYMEPGFTQNLSAYEFAAASGERELDDALAEVLQSQLECEGETVLEPLLLRYAELDAPRLLDLLRAQRGLGYANCATMWQSLYTLGVVDAAELAEMEVTLPLVTPGANGIAAPLPLPAEEMFRQALEITGEGQRRSMLVGVVMSWASEDPAAAFAATQSLEDEELRESLYRRLFPRWASVDFEAALYAAESLGDLSHIGSVLAQHVRVDPLGSVQIAQRYEAQDHSRQLLQRIAANWARQDIDAATAWLESLDPSTRSSVISNVAIAYITRDPEEAMDWLLRIEGDNPMKWSAAASLYIRDHPEAARRRIEQLGRGQTRDLLMSLYTTRLAQTEPERALAWLDQFDDAEVYRGMRTRVISTWADKNPEDAAAYTMTMEDEQLRRRSLIQLLDRWSRNDAESAERYLRGLDSAYLEDGLAILANTVADFDLARAFRYAEEIGNEARRKRAIVQIIRKVGYRDKQYARELVAQYDVFDDSLYEYLDLSFAD